MQFLPNDESARAAVNHSNSDRIAAKGKMVPAETERFASLLQAKHKELLGSLCKRDEIVIEKSSDALDEVQLMGERELAIRNLSRDSDALRLIRRALYRIAHGTYGLCLHCEEDILPKRMAAVPWAAYCIDCQEQIDRREIEVDEVSKYEEAAA